MNQNMMEGVLRSAWDAFYFFAIACVLSENQLKLELNVKNVQFVMKQNPC